MKKIDYNQIQWDTIDYSKVTLVNEICKKIKNHFWEIRPKGSNSSQIITNGPAYEFLIKAFSMYHTEWYERTSYAEKISFFISIPKEYNNNEKNKCYFLLLDGKMPEDAPISCNFSVKDKRRSDIMKCLRQAIKKIKDELKRQSIGNLCPYKNIVLTKENIDIHHAGKTFSEIANEWIELKGGIDKLYQYVNQSVGGGTITEFTSEELKKSFIEYHNKNAKMEAISRDAHKELHRTKRVPKT